MLTQRAFRPNHAFTRSDGGRAAAAAALLVIAMTAIFALDLLPQRLSVSVGGVAPSDVVAPRAASYVSNIQTAAARDAASKSVEPVYDYSSEKAIRIAGVQLNGVRIAASRPIDRAFQPDTTAAEKATLLAGLDRGSHGRRADEPDRPRRRALEAREVRGITQSST